MSFFVAFYSYKGGVGRSLALANVGYSLAARGKRVILVDMDLEAPGLQDIPEFALKGGTKKGFLEYAASYRRTGKCPKIRQYVHECRTHPGTGKLWLMPSGNVGASYQEELGRLPWRKLHPKQGTEPFVEGLRSALAEELQPDYVLIDARTGLSDIGGLSTHQLADMVVLVFNLTRSCVEGSVRAYRSFTSEGSRVRFIQLIASPVPSRGPDSDSLVERRLRQAAELMPLGTAYGRTLIRVDYDPAMVLAEELAVRRSDVYPAAAHYGALRESIQRANPEEVFPVLEQALELRSAGRLEEALDLLRGFTEEHSGNAEGYLELAKLLFEAGRAKEAIQPLRNARDLAPDLAFIHRRLGEVLVAAGSADEAVSELRRAEELGDRGRKLYVALARAYAEKGNAAQEIEARRKAMMAILRESQIGAVGQSSERSLPELRREFIEVLGRRPPFSSFEAEGFWDSVMGALSLSLQAKREILHNVLAGTIRPPEIINLFRLLREEESRWEDLLGPSAKDLQHRIAEAGIDPEDMEALLQMQKGNKTDAALLGFAALGQKIPLERQIDLLEQALRQDPENLALMEALGPALGTHALAQSPAVQRDLLEKTINLLDRCLIHQEKPLTVANMGAALAALAQLAQGEERKTLFEQARRRCREAVQLKPDSYLALNNWGNALAGLARLAEGEERQSLFQQACLRYQEAVQHKPDFHEALYNWGNALIGLARLASGEKKRNLLEEASEKYRSVNELKVGAGSYNLACALSLLGRFDEAEQALNTLLDRSPEMRSQALDDDDLKPLWEAKPALQDSLVSASQPDS